VGYTHVGVCLMSSVMTIRDDAHLCGSGRGREPGIVTFRIKQRRLDEQQKKLALSTRRCATAWMTRPDRRVGGGGHGKQHGGGGGVKNFNSFRLIQVSAQFPVPERRHLRQRDLH